MKQSQALVIDDNAKNVDVLTRLLTEQGINSIQVTNPTNLDMALNQVEDLRVVFLDLEMPGIDGYQVLHQLKSDPAFNDVPMVAYTVHVSEIKEAHAQGFDGFLGKPLDSDKFPDQLNRILNGQPVWETP